MATPRAANWKFDNTYARLPKAFFAQLNPIAVARPQMVVFNAELASSLGLNPEAFAGEEGVAVLSGNVVPPGAEPIAQAYAGHQFGHLNMLGDGRAILLGEQITPGGQRFDIQLKGSGPTPFSRRGDGRAALGPMLREFIISEAMHSLGIPTTRSLAVVSTGEIVYREKPLPGAVLARVAASHLRVGTFVYAAQAGAQAHVDFVRTLADYTIQRHYPLAETYLDFLRAVIDRQASLLAKWMLVGFVHGVMNTDNMALSGETIDYGPCAFMDHYSPATLFSSIDREGRYAYGNQPRIASWNLARFAATLLPLLSDEPEEALGIAKEAVEAFGPLYEGYWLRGMRGKLGLFNEEPEDVMLVAGLLSWMEAQKADFTNTFRALSVGVAPLGVAPLAFSPNDGAFRQWGELWQARLARQSQATSEVSLFMREHNPAVIPRNFRVEEALLVATENSDFSLIQKLLAALANPFQDSPFQEGFRDPGPPSLEGYRTFCGT